MKRFLLTMIVLIGIFPDNSVAQQAEKAPGKMSGIRFGVSYNELQEVALNRILHKGSGFTGGWFLEKSIGKTVRYFDLQLATIMLKSPFEKEISTYHFNIPASFHYLFDIYRGIPSTGFYAGGFAKMSLNIEYFENWDENHFYWLTAYSLGPDFRIEHCFPWKHKLLVEANLPVIALISRPPSNIMEIQSKTGLFNVAKKIHENPSVAFIDKNLEINFRARYSFTESKKIQPKLFWQIHYISNQIHNSERLKMINYSMGVEICF